MEWTIRILNKKMHWLLVLLCAWVCSFKKSHHLPRSIMWTKCFSICVYVYFLCYYICFGDVPSVIMFHLLKLTYIHKVAQIILSSVISPKLQCCQDSLLYGWRNNGDISRNLKVEGNKDCEKMLMTEIVSQFLSLWNYESIWKAISGS